MRPIFFAAVLLFISAGHLHAGDAFAKGSGTFHIPEFAYRILAIWVCYSCSQKLWYGLVEGKISPWRDLLDFYKKVYHRDTTPVRYWMEIGQMITGSAAGLFVAIFGWWQPNT